MTFYSESALVCAKWQWNARDCCRNARGRARNRKSNPEADRPRDLTYCYHKPECIVTNPDRLVLITIITWTFQFYIVNVSIFYSKYEYGARSESRFAWYSHCYVTWCTLATGIVVSRGPSAREAALVTRYLTPLISACLKSLKRILHNKTYLQLICKHNWRLQRCFWHKWLQEFPMNGVGDWHREHCDTRSPSLHTRLLDTGHM